MSTVLFISRALVAIKLYGIRKSYQGIFYRAAFIGIIVVIPLSKASAQKPILVHNQDTTYFLTQPMLDNITVTAKRITDPTTMEWLITGSELHTSVSGLTKDLQRDLPSMVRLYTLEGIPMLTKYTSNNSLTSTIPDSAVKMELHEPSAKYPNPDAPVILKPNFARQKSISLSPLNQTVAFSSGTEHVLAASIGLAHSGASDMLQKIVPELHAYSTTYAGYGALRADFRKIQTDVSIQYSQSKNEYGALLNIEKLEESEQSSNIIVGTLVPLGKQTLHAGFAYQTGWENRHTKESNMAYTVVNEIEAYSYTAALSRNNTEFRVNFHDLQRIYSYGEGDKIQMQRFESLLTHRQEFSPTTELTVEARFDHKDRKPSLSTELLLQPFEKIFFNFNAAFLYDAVGSEGLNSVMNSMQLTPHPWQTTYLRVETKILLGTTTLNASVNAKKARFGWYGESADSQGWISRLGAKGMLLKKYPSRIFMSWNLEGVVRNLSVNISDSPSQLLSGPARLEGHASLEAGSGNLKLILRSDAFIDRRIRISNTQTADLGSQYFLSLAAVRTMGPIQLGLALINGLALVGQENKIIAHFSETEGMRYISAPPFVNLTLGITF